MRSRTYSWPEGHWDWYRHLAFKHGIRTGRFVHVGGQVDKSSRGEPLHRDDLPVQIRTVVKHIDTVLRGFGATLADTVKLTAFYAAGDGVDEAWFVAAVADACKANGVTAERSGPVLVPVPLPWLALPGMRVEIEAVAMLGDVRGVARPGVRPRPTALRICPRRSTTRCAATATYSSEGRARRDGDPESGDLAYERLAVALGKLGAAPVRPRPARGVVCGRSAGRGPGRRFRALRRSARVRLRRAVRTAARAGAPGAGRRVGGVRGGRIDVRALGPAARPAVAAAGARGACRWGALRRHRIPVEPAPARRGRRQSCTATT